MRDPAHALADKELEAIEKRIEEIYRRANAEVEKKAAAYFKRFEALDKQKRALVESGEMTKDAYRKWKQGQIMTGKHWETLKRKTAERMNQANVEAAEYANKSLPKVYVANYNQIANGINNQVRGRVSFELVNENTIRNLSTKDKTLLPYKKVNGTKDIRWNTQKVNAEILQGIIQGDSVKDISKRLRHVTEMNRASSVRNARTAVTSAENKGRLDMLHDAEDAGIKTRKVWLSVHDKRTRDAHLALSGVEAEPDEPFEIFGMKIMYPGDPDAEPEMVYNCFVGDTSAFANADILRSYKHEYSGVLIEVKTSSGVNFSCTPNHPILTPSGWVSAASLNNGDDLLVTSVRNNLGLGRNCNVKHILPSMEAFHDSFKRVGLVSGNSSLSVNFHGDVPASDVEIVAKKRFLPDNWDSGVCECIIKFLLKLADKAFSCKGAFMKHLWRVRFSTLCGVGGRSKFLSILKGRLRHSEIHGLRPVALLDSGHVQAMADNVPGNIEIIGDCLDGFSGIVFADNIVSVNRRSCTTHVYNLQTENGYYFVNSSIPQKMRKNNGILAISKNCRCTMTYKVVGFWKAR